MNSREDASSVRSRWPLAAAAAWAAFTLTICLMPAGEVPFGRVEWCLLCGENGTANLVLNVGLYVPLGLAVRLSSGSLALSVLAGAVLSIGVETAQLWIPGRFTGFGDFLANTAGAGVGALLAMSWRAWLLPPPRRARMLAGFAALAAAATVATTGALFRTSLPDMRLFAGWTPDVGMLERYRGQVLSAELDGMVLAEGPLSDSRRVRESLGGGEVLTVHFQVGPPPTRLAPVFQLVMGDERGEVLQLGARGDDLVVRVRYRADNLGFARPELGLPGALSGRAVGDTVTVALALDARGRHRVRISQDAEVALALRPERGWALLRYTPTWARSGSDLLWIALLLFPTGWWARRGAVTVSTLAIPLAALAAVPLWTELAPAGPAAFLGAFAGFGAGGLARRMAVATRGTRDTPGVRDDCVQLARSPRHL